MFTRKRRAKLLMVGAVLAAGVLTPLSASAAASTATVAVRSGWFGLDNLGYCLDSNAKGQAYELPCQVPGNKYQDWSWTEWKAYSPYSGYYYFYSIQDQATGRCLDSNAAGAVYTNPCQAPGNAYQDWYWSAANVSGFSNFTDVATGLTLYGIPGSILGTMTVPTNHTAFNMKLIQ